MKPIASSKAKMTVFPWMMKRNFLSQKANSNLIGDKGSFTNYREGGEEGEGEGVGGNGHTKCGRRSRR